MKKFVLFVLAFATFATVGADNAQASQYSTACTLPTSNDSIVVNFGTRMYSDRQPNAVDYAAAIPAGKYKVALEAIDGYVGRAGSDARFQSEEQYRVQFRAGGSTIATSRYTQDLQDGIDVASWGGVVNSSLTLSQDVTIARAQHKVWEDQFFSPNSLTPTCMVLTPIDTPIDAQCNPALDGKYLQSKPTSELCTPGTAGSVRGSGTVQDPWMWDCRSTNGGKGDWCKAFKKKDDPVCGNGKIEAGETCDDGNTENGDGCSAQCTVEEVSTQCPYNATGDQIIVDGFSKRLVSPQGGTFQDSLSQMIPAGDYKVELASYDVYPGRPQTRTQPQERFKLVLSDGAGTITTSGSTQDLEDGVVFASWKGVVNNTLTIARKATTVTAMHTAYVDNTSANSVQPVCARLTPKAPVCGNGKVEDGETCDDGNTSNNDGCSAQCTEETPSIKIIKRDSVDKDDTQTITTGGTANFQIIVKNTGEVDLKTVVVNDPLAPNCNKTLGDLAVGETKSYTCTDTNVTETYKNIATTVGTPVNGTKNVFDKDPSDVIVEDPKEPNITITIDDQDNSDDTQTVTQGDNAKFTVVVTNTGNTDLTDVKVTVPLAPQCDRVIGDLAVGETKTYTCDKGNVQEAFTPVADVIGTQVGTTTTVTDDDPTEVLVEVPKNASIKIIKRDSVDKDDTQTITTGGTANFQIIVKNTGEVDLKTVVVNDPLAPNCNKTLGDLAVGETKSYTCTDTNVTETYKNIATTVGTPVNGTKNVFDKDPSDVIVEDPKEPNITIIKRDAVDKNDTQTVIQGGDATFQIIVHNTGDVDLTDVVVTDPLSPSCNRNFGDLAVGQKKYRTCTATNVQEGFTNIAHVTGDPVGGGDAVTDKDPSHVVVTIPGTPSITIDKHDAADGDDDQTVENGGTAKFEITVTNNGTVDLKDVVVTDATDPACNKNIGNLAAGESVTYTCDQSGVTESFTTSATATGISVEDGTSVNDTDPTNVDVKKPGASSISIVKRDAADKDDTQTVKVGGTANFEIIVKNTGDVDLTDVVVKDPLSPTCDKVIGNLAADETKSYTCAVSDVTKGFTNIADVTGTPVDGGDKVTDKDPSVVATESEPQGPVCGNGIVEAGEECDGGSQCTNSCEEEKEHDCDAKIGDRVWNDMNGNGIQDAGEPGISGVKMKVIDGNDKDYDTTDADGKYKFRDLCGKVRVIVATETLPAGCYQTYDRDGKLDHSYKRKLDDDESYKKADFGYRCPGAVTHKRSPETGAAGAAATGLATLLAGSGAWLNHRRTTRRQK